MGKRGTGVLRWTLLIGYSFTVVSAHADQGDPPEPAAAGDKEELAQTLQNPVADLISVPIQSNVFMGLGPTDQNQLLVNIQPVIPIHLGPRLNLITRTIMPIVSRPSATPGGERDTGLGDTVLSLFFSPAKSRGIIWGVGPVQLLPTATENALGAGQYGIGPTGVALVVLGGWTGGVLANHIWSVTGVDGAPDINQTLVQPFLSYTFAGGLTVGANSEMTYNWEAPEDEEWTIPLTFTLSKLVNVGKLPINLGLGGIYFPKAPEAGPEWGLRTTVVLVLPTGGKK